MNHSLPPIKALRNVLRLFLGPLAVRRHITIARHLNAFNLHACVCIQLHLSYMHHFPTQLKFIYIYCKDS